MPLNKQTVNHSEIRLTTPNPSPVSFSVLLKNAPDPSPAGYVIEVTGQDPLSGIAKTCSYSLDGNDHLAYLKFFEKLARDFNMRFPQNRQEKQITPTFKAPLRAVLETTIHPEIWYGYGDPAVIRVDAAEGPLYYLVATSNDAPHAFPLLRSRNLQDWEFVNFVFPAGQTPEWAATGLLISDYWAPEMHLIQNQYYVYFVARDKNTHELCIGKAQSESPEGPFVPDTEPVLRGNVIDPHVYVQDADTAYLYWKEDNNAVWPGQLLDVLYQQPQLITALFGEGPAQISTAFILTWWPWVKDREPMERFLMTQIVIEAVIERYVTFYEQLEHLCPYQTPALQAQIREVLRFMKTPVYAQRLSPDGGSLVGERFKIIQNDLAWEAHLVEGVWVTKQGNQYYLFYAGNDFSTDQYGIGVAIAESPVGPYRKIETPVLQSTAEWWAPGHPSVVKDLAGKPVLILHAYFPEQAGYKEFRAVLAVNLIFNPDQVLLA
jgi:arabinan endo-1,5-alpha-L-arabinosidase